MSSDSNLELLEMVLAEDPLLGDDLLQARKMYPKVPVNRLIKVSTASVNRLISEAEAHARQTSPVVTVEEPEATQSRRSGKRIGNAIWRQVEVDLKASDLTRSEIAKKYNVTYNSVCEYAAALGLTAAPAGRSRPQRLDHQMISRIREHNLSNPGVSPVDLAEKFDFSVPTILGVIDGSVGPGGKYIPKSRRSNGNGTP